MFWPTIVFLIMNYFVIRLANDEYWDETQNNMLLCSLLIFLIGIIFGILVSYDFVPNFFELLRVDGKLQILENPANSTQTFYYPEDTQREEYNVSTIFLNSTEIPQGCACSSSIYDELVRFRKPRLYSFYHNLNGSKTKFPSVACSGYEDLKEKDTVYYKIYGNEQKAK